MAITELIYANPKISIIIISITVTLITTIVRYFVTDKKVMKEIKDKQKIIREEMKLHKDNPDKMMELNKQMMEHLPLQMKQTFRLILITMVPLLILFGWLKTVFAQTTMVSSWLWWYIGVSMITGIILGKLFKLD